MDGLISRQAAIDATWFEPSYTGPLNVLTEVRDRLKALPSAQPERKKGEWIKEYWNGEHTRKCSACNITQTVTTYRGKVNFNYCPYCGARMDGESE